MENLKASLPWWDTKWTGPSFSPRVGHALVTLLAKSFASLQGNNTWNLATKARITLFSGNHLMSGFAVWVLAQNRQLCQAKHKGCSALSWLWLPSWSGVSGLLSGVKWPSLLGDFQTDLNPCWAVCYIHCPWRYRKMMCGGSTEGVWASSPYALLWVASPLSDDLGLGGAGDGGREARST